MKVVKEEVVVEIDWDKMSDEELYASPEETVEIAHKRHRDQMVEFDGKLIYRWTAEKLQKKIQK